MAVFWKLWKLKIYSWLCSLMKIISLWRIWCSSWKQLSCDYYYIFTNWFLVKMYISKDFINPKCLIGQVVLAVRFILMCPFCVWPLLSLLLFPQYTTSEELWVLDNTFLGSRHHLSPQIDATANIILLYLSEHLIHVCFECQFNYQAPLVNDWRPFLMLRTSRKELVAWTWFSSCEK